MNPALRSAQSITEALSEVERVQLQKTLGAESHDPARLARSLTSRDTVRNNLPRLSQDALDALKTWVLERGVWRSAPRMSRLAAGIEELGQHGWVFETAYGPYRRTAIVPWELMPHLLENLWEIPWDHLTSSTVERSPDPAPLWSPLIHDIFQIVSFARREPLLLTTQHEVYRRQLSKLESLMWERPHMSPSVTVHHMLNLAERLDLFEMHQNPHRLQVSAEANRLWRSGPSGVVREFSEYLFDPSHHVWPILPWVSLSSLLPANRALNISAAAAWLSKIGLASVQNTYWFDQALAELVAFDLWEMTGSGQGRLTHWAQAGIFGDFEESDPQSAIIQPTGEILVPPAVPLDERWDIDRLASPVKSDRVSIYRLDQPAVKAGVRQKLDAASHAAALTALARNPLPDNIRINLDDWYRAMGRHRVMEATLIHSQSAEDSRDLETLLGDDALERLSPTDIVIPAHRVKEILKRLAKAGSPLLDEVLRPSEATDDRRQSHDPPRYRPVWSIQLPGQTPAASLDVEEFRSVMQRALSNTHPVHLSYHVPGESQPRSEMVIPISVEPQWVQVYVVSQRRYVLVEWKQILDIEETEGPV